jgi:hypothetical protein
MAILTFLPDIKFLHERYVKKKKRWIFRYLKCTSSFSLCFENDKSILDRYTNACMDGDVDFKKFILGYLMIFAGETVS